MALPLLKAQLKDLIQSMFEEGLLNDQFTQIQTLQDESDPNFIPELISTFCNDAEKIITELEKQLIQPNVDFSLLESCVHQLKGSSSSIGAKQLKFACGDLQQAFDAENTAGCLQALNTVTHEYCLIRDKFNTLIQLEKRISAVENNHRQQNM